LEAQLEEYVGQVFEQDPIRATSMGVHVYDDRLGDFSADAIAERCRSRAQTLATVEATQPPPVGTIEWLDREALLMDLRVTVRQDEEIREWQRAPYWYAERLGSALEPLMTGTHAPLAVRGSALLSRLRSIPAYFADAEANLGNEVPAEWAEMGVTAAYGLQAFLAGGVRDFAAGLPDSLSHDVAGAAAAAAEAAGSFASFSARLASSARGSWRSGPDYFDFLLTEFHRLEYDHRSLGELGRELVAADTRALEEFAQRRDPPMTWQEQLSQIKEDHPQPADFLTTYGDEMVRAREHTLARDLITIPAGEICRMDWVPAYLVASLPIAVMALSPPFADGLAGGWLITPSDPSASRERQIQQMRDNCFVFAESIAGHETYPGHHLQRVHHKLATVDSPIRRLVSSPSFLEGWGLYVEDLQDETGFFANDAVRLFRLRNSLWRALRVVIDVGLHTGELEIAEAVALLQEQAGIDTHMAAGEIRRYIRHDNPTYPSSYVLGREAIHELRAHRKAIGAGAFNYRQFHDALLSYGTVPVSLVAQMLEPATANPATQPRTDARTQLEGM
jgi:uncharacterized protein (DUF885 family)